MEFITSTAYNNAQPWIIETGFGQVGFVLPASHRFFTSWGEDGEAKSLIISNVCCCKAPHSWKSPEFEPWAGAVGAGAGSAGTSEQADGGSVPSSDEEDG